MSTEVINIVVKRTGAGEASVEIQKIGQAADEATEKVKETTSATSYLKTALAGLGVGVVVNELKKQADVYQSIISRLKLVSTGAADLARQEQALFDISQKTRASFAETANLYNKLAIQAGQLGVEQSSLLGTIDLINQSIAASGATAQEASSGLLQFSQGLASNRFQGDELRSVLENLPLLGQQIAKGLGVTTGELRKMGEEGKLTAKLVLDAINKQAPEIQRNFSAITPTIAQAIQTLQNAWLRFVGTMDQASGASAVIAKGIMFIATNMTTLINVLFTATAAWVAYRAVLIGQAVWTGIAAGMAAVNSALAVQVALATAAGTSMTVLQKALWLVTLASTALVAPWALIAAGIAAVVAGVYLFGDAIRVNIGGNTISLMGALKTAWDYLSTGISIAAGWVAKFTMWLVGPELEKVRTVIWGISEVFRGWGIIIDWVWQQAKKLVDLFLGEGTVDKWVNNATKKLDGLGKEMEKATKESKGFSLATKDLGNVWKDTSKDISNAGGEVKKLTRLLSDDDIIKGIEEQNRKRKEWREENKRAFDEYIRKNSEAEEATRSLSATVRNSMGEMIEVTDEWARRSGAAFNKAVQEASRASSEITSSMSSAGGGRSNVQNIANFDAGEGNSAYGGSSTYTPTNTTPGIGDIGWGASNAGGNASPTGLPLNLIASQLGIGGRNLQSLISALSAADSAFGGLNEARTQAQLHSFISSLDETIAKRLVAAYPYINQRFERNGLQGFRNGGSFSVGGSGSPDSKLVQFMATPGERVRVTRPDQERRAARRQAQEGSGQRPVIVQMTVNTPDANSFRRSEKQLLTGLQARLTQVSDRLGG